jgi:DNA-binding NarL/FixJ family response regulator
MRGHQYPRGYRAPHYVALLGNCGAVRYFSPVPRWHCPAAFRDALDTFEQRVAELAASGMTNRNIAAAMFISPKTVEANLASIYAKLGIHSRAELGSHMSQPEG